MQCHFCKKELSNNKGGQVAHISRCKLNPNRVLTWNEGKTAQNNDVIRTVSQQMKHRVPWNKGKTSSRPAWNKGKKMGTGTPHTDAWKKEQSERKKALYAAGWEPTCGRSKKYDYTSLIAGKIKVDGTWELIAAKHLDKLGVSWIRNKKRFEYTNLQGKISTYQPDFYVSEWDSYIEVKGYETELDRCKWSQFPHKLIIWKKIDIDKIK